MEILHTLGGIAGALTGGFLMLMSVIFAPAFIIGLILMIFAPIIVTWHVGEPFWKER